MNILRYSLALLFVLSSCIMTEDPAKGSSILSKTSIDAEVQTANTGTFSLEENDGVRQRSYLHYSDAASNLYLTKNDDFSSVVWNRFWMGDSIIRQGGLASSLLRQDLDSLNPRVHYYLDKNYLANELSPQLDLSSMGNIKVKVHYYVDSYYPEAENYSSDQEAKYKLSIKNDSLWNHRIDAWPLDSKVLELEYLVESDSIFLVSDTLIVGVDTTYLLDTTIIETPKYSLALSQLDIWSNILTQLEEDPEVFHFINIGIELMDDKMTIPIKNKYLGNNSEVPMLAMFWSTDSLVDSVYTVNNEVDTIQVQKHASTAVKRQALMKGVKIPDLNRDSTLYMYTGLRDTLSISIPVDSILNAMSLNESDQYQDDKMIVWARLNIPIPKQAYQPEWAVGSIFNSRTVLPTVENSKFFVDIEKQFEPSENIDFRPSNILWENLEDDTLSIYINELVRRAVNYGSPGSERSADVSDTLKIQIIMTNTVSDSTITSSTDDDNYILYTSFNKLDLGLKNDVTMNIDLGWIDLERAQ